MCLIFFYGKLKKLKTGLRAMVSQFNDKAFYTVPRTVEKTEARSPHGSVLHNSIRSVCYVICCNSYVLLFLTLLL